MTRFNPYCIALIHWNIDTYSYLSHHAFQEVDSLELPLLLPPPGQCSNWTGLRQPMEQQRLRPRGYHGIQRARLHRQGNPQRRRMCRFISRSHSFRVDNRPTCDNGTIAAFAFYNGHDCQAQGFGPALNSFDRSDEYDGECLALVEFRSLAFICDGVGQISDKPTHTASSSETAPSAFIGGPSLTTTLIALSAYTLLPNITASGHSGPIETASVLPSQTGGLSPSPSPFTGGAPMIQLSTLGTILLAFGVIVFI